MENDLNAKLRASSLHLSKSQQALADYIIEHCDKAAFLTANKLGEAVGVSESTVVRFAVRLGYEGYPELQEAVQELIRNRLTAVQRLEVTTSLLDQQNVLRSVMREDIDRISGTLVGLSQEQFDDAVSRLLGARQIYIIGLRSSSALAEFLYFYFNLIFDNVKLLKSSSYSDLSEQLFRATDQDVVIGISFPRYSRITVTALEYARERGANVIAITDSPLSPLVEFSDCALFAESDTASFVDSLVAPMSLINALVVATGMHRRESLRRVYTELEYIWDKYEVYRKVETL